VKKSIFLFHYNRRGKKKQIRIFLVQIQQKQDVKIVEKSN